MKKDQVYRLIASSIDAYKRCIEKGNNEWELKHKDTIKQLVNQFLPSGSGWDNATTFDFDASTGDKLVFYGSFHHMDENGYYDGWTDHTITVKASMIHGILLSVSGRNRNDIKEYLYEIFDECLNTIAIWNDEKQAYFPETPIVLPNPFKDVPADIYERSEVRNA